MMNAWIDSSIFFNLRLAPDGSIAHYIYEYRRPLWSALNGFMLSMCLLTFLRRKYPREQQLLSLIEAISATLLGQDLHEPAIRTMLRATEANVNHALTNLATDAQRQMQLRSNLYEELEKSRHVLNQLTFQRETILHAATTEMTRQYQSVISYAHYLDEQIDRNQSLSDLRYDYDDVCETGFNLKLIAGALKKLSHTEIADIKPVSLARLMQNTLLALSSSLDRRAMKLTTTEVDESVMIDSDATLLSHVIWMMLLGTIRYAADESTLHMRCFYDQPHKHAIMSIVVSELAPGTMTPDERTAHLERQMNHDQPHMFADTIAIQANIKLAELLLQKTSARIETVPLSPYACEIRITFPL